MDLNWLIKTLELFPQPGLPWGSNSPEERSVRVERAGGSPTTLRRFPRHGPDGSPIAFENWGPHSVAHNLFPKLPKNALAIWVVKNNLAAPVPPKVLQKNVLGGLKLSSECKKSLEMCLMNTIMTSIMISIMISMMISRMTSICLLYTSDAADDLTRCRSRWSPYH